MQIVTIALMSEWRLSLLMHDRGLKDEDVAERLGEITGKYRHPKTIARWRLAETKPKIDVDDFDALCQVLNCSRNELWSK
jgi:DNA-binding Xre family transcriptional regulator